MVDTALRVSEVFNEDCMIGMARYPNKYFDLAVVDPPYGINAAKMQMGSHPTRSRTDGYGSGPGVSTAARLKGRLNTGSGKLKNRVLNKSSIDWDNEIPTDAYFTELFRVSKHQIIWGGNYFPLSPSRGIIVWDKCQPWDNFSQVEIAWTSLDMPAKIFRHSNTGGTNAEKKIHPTQKPIQLYDWIYLKFLQSGGKVIDTHLGSGSNRIAANKAGNIDFTAFEINSDYFRDQEKRWKGFIAQTRLF